MFDFAVFLANVMGLEMGKLQANLQTDMGSLSFTWGSTGLLKSIQIHPLSKHCKSGFSPVEGLSEAWQKVLQELTDYFGGGNPLPSIEWDDFDRGEWTDFQQKVYEAILKIPHGETRSYAWVAEQIQKSGAAQAVGQALRNNPVPILIPCHRVINKKGSLGGFMGQKDLALPELSLKDQLIRLEDGYLNPQFPFMNLLQAEMAL